MADKFYPHDKCPNCGNDDTHWSVFQHTTFDERWMTKCKNYHPHTHYYCDCGYEWIGRAGNLEIDGIPLAEVTG